MKKTLATLVLVSFAGVAMAQQALKPEEMIKYRKAAMNFMGWNMGKIKANLEGAFNAEQALAAANAVAATANSGLGALHGQGSDKDAGGEKTRLKSEYFQNQDKVREVAMNFNKEANELAKIAATGDKAAIQAQFGKTGASCKACHDSFRN